MSKFVWVEDDRIRKTGEWFKVLREEDGRLLCASHDPFARDIYIEKSDVLHETYEEIF